jgi:hypothetical protein
MIVGDDSQEPLMCRWDGCFGQPVLIDELPFRPPGDRVRQRRHAARQAGGRPTAT